RSVWEGHSPSATSDTRSSASFDAQQEVPPWQTNSQATGSDTQQTITAWHDQGRWPYNKSAAPEQAEPSGGYQAIPPASIYSNGYQPQAGLNQSKSLNDPIAPSGGYAAGVNGQYTRQFDPETGRRIDYQAMGTYSPQNYRAGSDTQQAGPGVAQFQGMIEKPALGTSYDRDRSGVY
ncbi:unnamed protein product, partial [marine sediment metagenome]